MTDEPFIFPPRRGSTCVAQSLMNGDASLAGFSFNPVPGFQDAILDTSFSFSMPRRESRDHTSLPPNSEIAVQDAPQRKRKIKPSLTLPVAVEVTVPHIAPTNFLPAWTNDCFVPSDEKGCLRRLSSMSLASLSTCSSQRSSVSSTSSSFSTASSSSMMVDDVPGILITPSAATSQSQLLHRSSLNMEDLVFERMLGRGNCATVWLARHTPTGVYYAVKKMDVSVSDAAGCKAALAELRSLNTCNSPHIVTMHDAFLYENSIHVVLDFCEGGSLADVMEVVNGPFPEFILSKIAYRILHGLHYLHKKCRIIHRDIKSQNVLITAQGEVKITDFGMSSAPLESTIARTNSFLGTLLYMSPERIRGDAHSFDSDVYAFGILVAHCALGRYPDAMHDKCYFSIMERITNLQELVLPPETASAELRDFVRLCTQHNPAARPRAKDLLVHPFITMHRHTEPTLQTFMLHVLRTRAVQQAQMIQTQLDITKMRRPSLQ